MATLIEALARDEAKVDVVDVMMLAASVSGLALAYLTYINL